jgi:hypothetical protein
MAVVLVLGAPGAARALGFSAQGAAGVGQLVNDIDGKTGATYGAIFGLHFAGRIGLELEYQHGENDANGITGQPTVRQDGAIGHGRFDLLRGRLVPFVYGGVGWMHYSASGVSSSDRLVVPAGAGLEVRLGPFEFGARGEYQWIFNDVADRSANFWKVIGTAGVRFGD